MGWSFNAAYALQPQPRRRRRDGGNAPVCDDLPLEYKGSMALAMDEENVGEEWPGRIHTRTECGGAAKGQRSTDAEDFVGTPSL